MQLPDFVKEARNVLEEKKATNLKVMDLKEVSDSIDYFVIASGTSAPHLKALQNALERMMKNNGWRGYRKAGDPESGWVVMDYEYTMIHLFTPEVRAVYDLENLWQDARALFECPAHPAPTSD
jgi:ribosome-associated protein